MGNMLDWKIFHRISAVSLLSMAMIILVQIFFFMSYPPPYEGTELEWFQIFDTNPLLGLISFEGLMIVYMLLSIFPALSLAMIHWRLSSSGVLVYLVISVIGIMAFIAARPAFEMLAISNSYFLADTEVERNSTLAAGKLLLSIFHGTAFQVSYLMGSISGLVISFIMLKAGYFNKTIPILRIASSICDWGLYLPGIGLYISIFSVLFLFVWNLFVAKSLVQISRSELP
ncbi:MAG TPA: hypothetical protein VN226_00560 [Anaerolineales bacterium]|nr:hypothetical protein [Anaerolineales bacterium]